MPSVMLCQILASYDLIKQKSVQLPMFQTTVFVLIFTLGVTIAYLFAIVPSFLFSIIPGKRQIDLGGNVLLGGLSGHDTSLILRVKQRIPVRNPDVEKEAVAAMNLALDMQAQGKNDKAMKLYQHALALDPQHVDILTAYGEFLEIHEKDVLQAEFLYSKALSIRPDHTKALANKKRILPIVEEIDQINFNRIDLKRDHLYDIPSSHAGLRRAKKEAYFLHIYHTNAIEGNTLTLSQTRAIVETRIAVGGKSLLEQNEVLGLDAALSYINSTLLGRIGSVTLEDILEIHKRVLGYVDPLEAGRIRTTQVFVGDFTPPPASELSYLMDEFIDWLNDDQSSKLHPIEFAALAHYKLVTIHPFYDGNGRTSRLLMNLILMQAGFPPVTIKVEDRHKYYEVLNQGNDGDIRPFIRFIADSTERTLDEFLLATVDSAGALALQLLNFTENEKIIRISKDEE